MDDMLCYIPSREQHLKDVREVLSILRQEGLYVKLASSGTASRRLALRSLALRKVSAVLDWQVPTSNAELCRFVGLCNYYRRFVDEYASPPAPVRPTRIVAVGCGGAAEF